MVLNLLLEKASVDPDVVAIHSPKSALPFISKGLEAMVLPQLLANALLIASDHCVWDYWDSARLVEIMMVPLHIIGLAMEFHRVLYLDKPLSLFMLPLDNFIWQHGIDFHCWADDTGAVSEVPGLPPRHQSLDGDDDEILHYY